MAANQTSNQRSKAGGRHSGTHSERKPATIDESTDDYGSMGEMAEQASEYVTRGASHVREYARDHGGATVVVALAAGFGIGLAVGRALGIPHRQPRRWRDRVTAEGIGRKFLDRIEGMIPDVLAERFGK